MMPIKYPCFFDVEDETELIVFDDLAGRMATALHPADSDSFGHEVTRQQIKNDLVTLVDNGGLTVRTRAGLGPHPFPIGAALDDAVLFAHELTSLLRDRGMILRTSIGRQLEAQEEAKKKAGRYNLEQAAELISGSGETLYDTILARLLRAAANEDLPTYMPFQNVKNSYAGGASSPSSYFDECYWDELNDWLARFERRVAFRFPKPQTLINETVAATAAERMPKQKDLPNYLTQPARILKWLIDNGYNPKKLPARDNGASGVKAKARAALKDDPLFIGTKKPFDTAWQQLRDDGEIVEGGEVE